MAYTKGSCVWCGVWYSSPLFAWWYSCFWSGEEGELSTWFDSKQSRDIVELPQTCHHRPAFCGIAFRTREAERHLLDLDPNGGVDPSGFFPMFFRETASVLAPKLSCLFRRLLRGGEFPLEWRIADVTPIPKGPLSALVCNYRPISITPVLSKVFERLIALRFFFFFFGEIWGPAFSPVFIQEEIGYLWCSSWHRLCWSVGIRQGWRACARPDWFQCGLWQG